MHGGLAHLYGKGCGHKLLRVLDLSHMAWSVAFCARAGSFPDDRKTLPRKRFCSRAQNLSILGRALGGKTDGEWQISLRNEICRKRDPWLAGKEMPLCKDILLLSGILVAQRELSLPEDNREKRHLGIVYARKQIPLMAGGLTEGWKCHVSMTNCEYVASAGRLSARADLFTRARSPNISRSRSGHPGGNCRGATTFWT
jgi:hypothetical protein